MDHTGNTVAFNTLADGSSIHKDGIKIAEYMNSENCEGIYYIYDNMEEKESYLRNFYGYVIQPYQKMAREDIGETVKVNVDRELLFLFPKESEVKKKANNFEEIDLHTEKLSVCVWNG